MSITVLLNEYRATVENADRLVTYQPSADRAMDVASCIDMVVAVKGRYTTSPNECPTDRVDKFMAHLSFGKTRSFLPSGFEDNQVSLAQLEFRVERAQQRGLTDLQIWISIVNPYSSACEDEFRNSFDRSTRALRLLCQAERMCGRLGGKPTVMSHPAGLLQIELSSDGEFWSCDGLITEQDGSDGIPMAVYLDFISIILRTPLAN